MTPHSPCEAFKFPAAKNFAAPGNFPTFLLSLMWRADLRIDAAQNPDPDRVIRIERAEEYPKQLWYFIASFIAAVSIAHYLVVLSTYVTLRSRASWGSRDTRGTVSILRLPLALLNMFRVIAFRTTVPVSLGGSYALNLAELFLTGAYIAALFTWSFINSTAMTGQRLDPKYWANVAGNIAGSQLALMTALGMKNNIISILTGISFDKLSYLHRVSARVLCLLTWIHGAGRLMIGLTGAVTWPHPWVQCGLLASTSLTILSLLSVRPIREARYETFKIFHLVFGVIFVLSAYFHANGQGDGQYVWPTILIWGLDRFARLMRIFVFNWKYFIPFRNRFDLDASIDVLSPHFLRVSMKRPGFFRWIPGQSVYLTFPTISPIQAHPFTICTYDMIEKAPVTSPEQITMDNATKNLVFLVRVRNGFTRALFNKVDNGPRGAFPVLLDGPYSSPPVLSGYERVILIAGGSGVAFTLPLLLDLLHRANSEKLSPTKIVFVWAIREAEHVEWISDALLPVLENVPSLTELEIRICVTSNTDSSNDWDDDSTHESDGDQEKTSSPNGMVPNLFSKPMVKVSQGRPDLRALIDEEIKTATGAISVNVCGTLALAKAVRSAVNAPRFMDILRGGPSISLHVEAFGAQ